MLGQIGIAWGSIFGLNLMMEKLEIKEATWGTVMISLLILLWVFSGFALFLLEAKEDHK